MWKFGASLWIVFTFHLNVYHASNITHCAYRNLDFSVSDYGNQSTSFQDLIDQSARAHATFLDNGYERCDDTQGPSSCYTMAVQGSSGSLRIIKQGCWLSKSPDLTDCQNSKCILQTSTNAKLRNVTLNFCCCRGSKCNEMSVESETEEPHISISTKQPKHDTPVLQYATATGDGDKEYSYCAYKFSKTEPDSKAAGVVLPNGKTMRCDKSSSSCFTYWVNNTANGTREIIYQGCWDPGTYCNPNVCVSQKQKEKNYTGFFCCCSGFMCNNNISSVTEDPTSSTADPSDNGPDISRIHDPSYKERTIIISLLSVFLLAVIIFVVFILCRYCNHTQHEPLNSSQAPDLNTSPGFDIDDLKISCLLSKGRYSEVWKGALNEQDVAVKIYSSNYRQYYDTEKYVYSLPHMSHKNLLKFYGAEEQMSVDGCVQYLLVLQLIPNGTLMNYLKNNTIDWNTMCQMCHSLARGLSHLHSDLGSDDNFKPTVAHRDLNSRNILVKSDLSLVIADLGFSMVTMGSKVIHKGHTENAEQSSLTEVGTQRYMAPEMLEGAVNLRDCAASLKQIDIYSLGLVMWEISSRCIELYQGCPMPDFALPFQAEVGGHPTLEGMQLLVSRNKYRPKFPEVWKEYNQAIRALKETIEECWDHDAEARLTALCVEERIIEMKNLWSHENRNKGVTPTINTALLSHVSNSNRMGYNVNGGTQWGGLHSTGSESMSANVNMDSSSSALIINDIHDGTTSTTEQSGGYHPPSWIHDRSGSVSTSTVETSVSATPQDMPQEPMYPKSQNINAAKYQMPIQPHQGRNPTVERNTHKRSDEELAVVGNNLFYGKDRSETTSTQSAPANTTVSDNIFDSLSDNLETSLMQNDILNHHRSPPISYLQNQVHGNNTGLPPKMANNTGNNGNHSNALPPGHSSSNQRLPRTKKPKEMGILSHLALLGKLALSGGKGDGRKSAEKEGNTLESGTVYNSVGQHNPLFEPQHTVETEVRISNGSAIVRPAQLPVSSRGHDQRSSLHDPSKSGSRNQQQRRRDQTVSLDMDVSRPANTGSGGRDDKPLQLFSRLRGTPYSKSTSDLSPQKTCSYSRLEEEIKLTRPTTLSLKGHNYNHIRHPPCGSMNSLVGYKPIPGNALSKGHSSRRLIQMGRGGGESKSQVKPSNILCKKDVQVVAADPTERIKTRLKTPPSEKRGRFSLYDDRLMSEKDADEDNCDLYVSEGKLGKPSISLQQFNVSSEIKNNTYVAADCTC